MIAALLAGALGACGMLLWLSPGPRVPGLRARRRPGGFLPLPRRTHLARSTERAARGRAVLGGSVLEGARRSGAAPSRESASTSGRRPEFGHGSASSPTDVSRGSTGSEVPLQGAPALHGASALHGAPALPAAALVELTACQLDAGLPLSEAVGILSESCAGTAHPGLARAAAALRLGLPWDKAWPADRELSRDLRDFRDALEFTASSATASASVLRGQAELVRRAQYRRAERAAEALAVKLVLPLGLCFLPAFMCWGVVPVLMSLLPRVFGS